MLVFGKIFAYVLSGYPGVVRSKDNYSGKVWKILM